MYHPYQHPGLHLHSPLMRYSANGVSEWVHLYPLRPQLRILTAESGVLVIRLSQLWVLMATM